MNFIYIYVWSGFMFLFFIMSSGVSLVLRYYEISLLVEWMLLSVNSIMVEIFILIDWVSLLFVSIVMIISSMVIMYSIVYMGHDKTFDRFIYLVVMFVVSMLMMIMSPSLVSVLFGWDMLGLVSYCLVIYYQSFKAFNSGMVTVLTNRIGDVGLLLSIGLVLVNGSWNIFMLSVESSLDWLFFLVLLAAVTKSAQMPFSTWLPMAMAAPTPVSALVHSSTLVTAGVYLIIRFSKFIMLSGVNYVLLYLSLLTMIMSGVMANYEIDLKKIIALSTLSQLGLMMLVLSVGMSLLGFYHLITHAVFKSLLFLCAGVIIHVMKDSQDIRYLGGVGEIMPFVMMSMYVSILSLMGFPFLSGFYSKDMMMEVFYILEIGWVQMSLILLSLSLTVMYSLRLCFYMSFSSSDNIKCMVYLGLESSLMNFSTIMLVLLSVMAGAMFSWVFFYDLYMVCLTSLVKMLTLLFFLSGVVSWLFIIIEDIFDKCFSKCGVGILLFNVSMWLLNFFHISIEGGTLFSGSYLSESDRVWTETSEGSFWAKFKFVCMKFYYFSFKTYYVIFIILSMLFMGMLMIF